MAQILLIEDNVPSMNLAALLMENSGHQVLKAYNAEDGINLAQENLPDLILMDIDLPKMDGLTATRLLKNCEQTRHVKVVAMTGSFTEVNHKMIKMAGCEGFISKPIRVKDFMKTVKEVLARPN